MKKIYVHFIMSCDCSCPCPEGFCVSIVSDGYAVTSDGSVVTSTAASSACSDVNYEDAWFKALTASQQQAYLDAKNSANIIDQTVDIMTSKPQVFEAYMTFQKAILQNFIETPIINHNITCDYSAATIFKTIGNTEPFTVTLTNFTGVPTQTIYCLLILVDNYVKPSSYPSQLIVQKPDGTVVIPTIYYNPSLSSLKSIAANATAPNKLAFQYNLYPEAREPYATLSVQTFSPA